MQFTEEVAKNLPKDINLTSNKVNTNQNNEETFSAQL